MQATAVDAQWTNAQSPWRQIAFVRLGEKSAQQLMSSAMHVASLGGPDAQGTAGLACEGARALALTLAPHQKQAVVAYRANALAAIVFSNLAALDDPLPEALPAADRLCADIETLTIASRSQILLELLGERAFAYDIENKGRIVRLVGNFLGGGFRPLPRETPSGERRSSHHGGLLGAHTEGPYHSTRVSRAGHSPSPSTLILSARWNPALEPTTLVPLNDILNEIPAGDALGLVVPCFSFETSDSYGRDESPKKTSLLDVYDDGQIHLRMNVHRAFVEDSAPEISKAAFVRLQTQIARARPARIVLTSETCLAIRNTSCLHGRDSITDNRRLLIRLFGYAGDVDPVVINNDPLVVKG